MTPGKVYRVNEYALKESEYRAHNNDIVANLGYLWVCTKIVDHDPEPEWNAGNFQSLATEQSVRGTEKNWRSWSMNTTTCRECGDEFSIRRYALGYRVCLSCGEEESKKITRCTVPFHKQGYSLVTNRAELKQLNPKRIGDA